MAIKDRVLNGLNSLLSDISGAVDSASFVSWEDFFDTLKKTRELCVKGLPKDEYALKYAEIYDGLILAIEPLARGEKQRHDVLLLCKELLYYAIKATQDERRFKKEMVFLPYKASMWDSLESIWLAAMEDKERVLAYVVPIPYADLDENVHVKEWHLEKELFPTYVPTLDWREVNLEELRPDIIFIHNPYDDGNLVTSVEKRYYSKNLKNLTNLLIYVPYDVTTGGLGDVKANCASLLNVDYTMVQSENMRKLFPPSVPADKLIPLGSPKLDRVVRMCENPPEIPPEWRKKIEGKKVYFYNTSLGGMFSNVAAYLMKMVYVFKVFAERKDICLIWRPHPLTESSFVSMRPQYLDHYKAIKEAFIKEDFGIYDDTPDIDKTIALSDAYIGDPATSLIMLFGIVGKPVFILDNTITELPSPEDWRFFLGEGMFLDGGDIIVSPTNRLYRKNPENNKYRYVLKLCEYDGGYYHKAIKANGKTYICPSYAQDIMVVSENGIEEKIPFERRTEVYGSFSAALRVGDYIALIPYMYPAIVLFYTKTNNIRYIKGYNHIFVKKLLGGFYVGGSCVWRDNLFIASPDTPEVISVNLKNFEVKVLTVHKMQGGCIFMAADGDDIWLIPFSGYTICKWNPETMKVRVYSAKIEGLHSTQPAYKYECEDLIFGRPAFDEDYLYLPPYWGNSFVKLNKKTGEVTKWNLPLQASVVGKSSYYSVYNIANFTDRIKDGHWRLFYIPERKVYDVDLKEGACSEIPVEFEDGAVLNEAVGFSEQASGLRYCCVENAFHTLPAFLDGKLPGKAHNKELQIQSYTNVATNCDGSSGVKIYQFAMKKAEEKDRDKSL